jgi:hypothetical protein
MESISFFVKKAIDFPPALFPANRRDELWTLHLTGPNNFAAVCAGGIRFFVG